MILLHSMHPPPPMRTIVRRIKQHTAYAEEMSKVVSVSSNANEQTYWHEREKFTTSEIAQVQ